MHTFTIRPIGFVRKPDRSEPCIEILPEYEIGLYRLETISHIFVLWWIHEADTPERRGTRLTIPRVRNPIAPPQEMGNLATRSPNRPNPIGLTVVKIVRIDGTRIYVDEIDAFDGTPVIDIKPYLPSGDRVSKEVTLPKWFEHLLESRPADRRLSLGGESVEPQE